MKNLILTEVKIYFNQLKQTNKLFILLFCVTILLHAISYILSNHALNFIGNMATLCLISWVVFELPLK